MADFEISFDPVDSLTAGAVGEPGHRVFYLQATRGAEVLSVLVEKEQVAVLATRVLRILDQVAAEFPDLDLGGSASGALVGDPIPLFRAVAIGIGFDAGRRTVVLELHEQPVADDDDDQPPEGAEAGSDRTDGYVARLWCTPAQARAMAECGAAAVEAGRPPCPRCGHPLDPAGHMCPKLNGHAKRPDA